MQIPIKNIYYLLCYAWNKLEESENINVGGIGSTELVDLFAKILVNTCSRLLKQGLEKYYLENEELVSGIKGKLNFSATIKQNSIPLNKTACIYDKFDYDILPNQILKTTIGKLLKTKKLDLSLRDELNKIYLKLPPISDIAIRKSIFKQIRLHRNNYHYDLILKVCQIINENLFIDETKRNYKFKDFIREEKAMARLFESFVRNFYKIETDFLVSSDSISWQFESDNSDDLAMLPKMLTDITLRRGKRKIIIDTKYYKEAFQNKYNSSKINSNNLYQLFAYLKNQETNSEITQNCEGILLYPSVQNDFIHSFKHENHKISIISLNLNQDWYNIRTELFKIIS